jgi:hypothetical protein
VGIVTALLGSNETPANRHCHTLLAAVHAVT